MFHWSPNSANPSGHLKQIAQLLLVFLCGLFIYGLWLGNSPLDRTEPFRALVADRMAHGGSWLLPRLYGELYLRKPPLIYWIEASVQLLAGRGNEFVWRLPSVVGSAFLAAFLAWWTGRWFGESARLPAGFSCLALVALWDQNRSADIDALNTVAAVISSVCVLELVYGLGRADAITRPNLPLANRLSKHAWRFGWTLWLGLAVGSTLLLKGPGGLPQIFAAIIGPAILLRRWKPVWRPTILVGLLIGFAIFATYIVAAKISMQHAGITPDRTGSAEVIEKVFLHGWLQRVKALGIPFALLAFALPVSALLPLAVMLIRQLPEIDLSRQRVMAILGTLGATLIIWVLDGNDNPRYEYVMLPLLAPVVGFVWAFRGRLPAGSLSSLLLAAGVLLCGGDVLITLKAWGLMPGVERFVAVVGVVCSVFAFFAIVIGRFFEAEELAAASPVGGAGISIGVVILLLLFAIPMAARKNAERRTKSAKTPAAKLREVIGSASRVSAAGVVRDLPELFYYAHVDVDSYGEFGLPKLVATARGHWVVISENESYPAYSTIMKYIPKAFPQGVHWLPMHDPRDKICVGWYDPPAGADLRIDWHEQKHVEAEE